MSGRRADPGLARLAGLATILADARIAEAGAARNACTAIAAALAALATAAAPVPDLPLAVAERHRRLLEARRADLARRLAAAETAASARRAVAATALGRADVLARLASGRARPR